jgi:phosphoribosylformimino-5-aminoimidazole carboxamide ribotide isomerase
VAAEASGFTLYPAIDLRGGRCVRLEKGDAARQTVYADDPLAVAAGFAAAGARWLHVVDLDAAFGEGSNRALIGRLAAECPLAVQTGGGLRRIEDLEEVLEVGARRVVIGTAAVENPALVDEALARWGPERVAVGLDARGRTPALRGWREPSGADLFGLGRTLAARGVTTLVHTDIERDGMLGGPNLELSAALAEASGAEVIVSGGVSGMDDVRAALRRARAGAAIGGMIVGKALYEARFDLAEAIRLLEE